MFNMVILWILSSDLLNTILFYKYVYLVFCCCFFDAIYFCNKIAFVHILLLILSDKTSKLSLI